MHSVKRGTETNLHYLYSALERVFSVDVVAESISLLEEVYLNLYVSGSGGRWFVL